MAPLATACRFTLAFSILTAVALAGDTRLPTAEEVKSLQKAYRSERDALLKSGAKARFLPNLFDNAELIAKRADSALDANRLLQASEAFRQARWQLPYQGPNFPDHVARVFGSLRVRHAHEILAVAFSPDGKLLATAGRDRGVRIWDMSNGHELLHYRGHDRYVRHLAFSPDGKWLASAGGDKDVRLWEPRSGKDIRTLAGTGSYVTAMAVSPDGSHILAASDDRTLTMYDAATGDVKHTADFKLFAGLRSLAFSPDGKRLAAGAENGQVRLWVYPDIITLKSPEYWSQQDEEGSSNFLIFSPDSKQLVRCGPDAVKVYDVQQPSGGIVVKTPRLTLTPPEDPKNKSKIHAFLCAALSKDGRTLFVGCTDGLIRLFDASNGQAAGTFKGHNAAITALMFNQQGTQLASASSDYTVRLWDFDIVLQARDFIGHTEPIWCADFSPDGHRLVSCGADHTCRLWEVAGGAPLRSFGEPVTGLTTAHFSPDGKAILTGGGDKLLRLYEADSGKLLQTFTGHTGTVTSAAFNADGSKIVSGGADKAVIVWAAATGKPLATCDASSIVMAVLFAPDGQSVVAGTVDQRVRFFNAETGKPGETWQAHSHAVSGLAFDAKGETLVTCGFDSLVRLWPLATPGKNGVTLSGHGGPLSAAALRFDGQYLVSAGNDHVVKLWKQDVGKWKEAQIFRGHTDWVTSLAFSRDGHFIVSASADKTMKVWEIASRELPLTSEHTGAVEAVAVSPDNKWLASGGTDRTIKIWDRATGVEMLSLRGHTDTILALAFSPDSKTLYSSAADRDIRRWSVANGKELPSLENQHQLTGFVAAVPLMALSPDGTRLFAWVPVSERGSTLQIFNTKDGDEVGKCLDRDRHILSVSFAADGKTAAAGAKDGSVRVWKLQDKNETKPIGQWQPFGKGEGITSIAVGPGFVACGGDKGKLAVCEPVDGKVLKSLAAHAGPVTACAVSPDGKWLVTGGADNLVKLWDRVSGNELRRWTVPPLTRLTFTPDGRFVATAHANTALFLLELP